MVDVRGRFLGLPHGTAPAAVTTNKNIKMSSFKSSKIIQKKEGGPDRSDKEPTFMGVDHLVFSVFIFAFSCIQFCNHPRDAFYPLEWSGFEEEVVYLRKPPTRNSLL